MSHLSESLAMHGWSILLFMGLSVQPHMGGAQTTRTVPVPATPQLSGLTATEAAALIAKLEDAQRRVQAGQSQPFELLAGSIASYDQTKITPREAFLKVPFQKVWDIRRVRTDNRLWQPYRLAYAPNGLGQLYWDIEVVLGFNGNIERVLMTYRSLAPF